ncbi:MAG: NigD-like protein [Parabacteroides sp.]|nr:NigD-like protein [Parabacteroides sp.]
MKPFKVFAIATGLILSTLVFNSCLSDDDDYSLGNYWISIATVEPLTDNNYSLILDDGTKLWPAATNYPGYSPKDDQRALVNYTILSDSVQGYDHYIKVNSIQNILTKSIASLTSTNDADFGNDPVKIINMWVGGGYLNVQFGFNYGGAKPHFINLVRDTTQTSDPKILEFRHNAYDDQAMVAKEGLVAFNLSSLIEAGKDSVEFTVKVKTFDGDKTYDLNYNWTKNDMVNPKSISVNSFGDIK